MDTAQRVLERQERRYRLLRHLYDVTDGGLHASVSSADLAAEAGLSDDEADTTLDYLVEEGLAEYEAFGPMVSITHRGVVEVEQSINQPEQPTPHFPMHITQHFHASVGAVQNGSQNTAHIAQNDLEKEMFQLTVALSQTMAERGGNVVEFAAGSHEHMLAEMMVERGRLKRLEGMPGHYMLP